MYLREATIIPAVIPTSLQDLQDNLEKISVFSKYLQIDVVDGEFAPFVSWPYRSDTTPTANEVRDMLREYDFEVDLMVKDQLAAARFWIDAGAKALVFHLEGLSDPRTAIDLCRSPNVQIGFSINNDTPLDTLFTFVDELDYVQLMGISLIGTQGQPFDSRVLERIATLRALYPSLTISVDGSMNKETISEVKKAGADRFAVGSYILKSDDPEERFKELLKIIS